MKKIQTIWAVIAASCCLAALFACNGTSDSGNGGILEVARFDTLRPAQFDMNGSGQIVWTAGAPGEAKVYLYENGGSRDISAPGAYCDTPRLSNDGRVVWTQLVKGYSVLSDVYLYDGGKAVPLTGGDRAYQFPMLNNRGEVVWQGATENGQEEWGIFYYDIAAGSVKSLSTDSDGVHDVNPQLGPNGELLLQRHDVAGAALSVMSPKMTTAAATRISSGKIAFDDSYYEKSWYIRPNMINRAGAIVYADEAKRIILRDGASETVISSGPGSIDNAFAEINDSGQVVFEGYDGSSSQIYLYSGGKTSRISGGSICNRFPHINSSGQVVWQGKKAGKNHIFLYDGNQVRQISDTRRDNILPRISYRGDIAWLGREWKANGWHYTGILLAPAVRPAKIITTTLAGDVPIPIQGVFTSATAAEPAKQASGTNKFSFIVFGDSRGADASVVNLLLPQANYDFISYMASSVNNEFKPDFMFFLGDMTTRGNGVLFNFLDRWIDAIKPLYDAKNLYVAKGNHELYGAIMANNRMFWYPNQVHFQDRFAYLPANGPNGYKSLAYSFVYGNSYFMFLDSFFCTDQWNWEVVGYAGFYEDITNDQLAWSKAQMATDGAQGAVHRFVLTHTPMFSDEGVNATNNLARLSSYMDDNRFDCYFGAHEHLYSRKLLDGKGLPDIGHTFKNNVLQLVTGAGGADTDSPKSITVRPEDGWKINLVQHFVLVQVDGDKVTAKAYQVLKGGDGKYYHDITPFDVVSKTGTNVTIGQ